MILRDGRYATSSFKMIIKVINMYDDIDMISKHSGTGNDGSYLINWARKRLVISDVIYFMIVDGKLDSLSIMYWDDTINLPELLDDEAFELWRRLQ